MAAPAPLTDFSAGELSPKMRGKVATEIYSKGLELVENYSPIAFGGMTRRPGTWRVSEFTKGEIEDALIIPYPNDDFDDTFLLVWEYSGVIAVQPWVYDGSTMTAGTTRYLINTFPGSVDRSTKWARIERNIYLAGYNFRPFTIASSGTVDGWSIAWTTFDAETWDSEEYYAPGDVVLYSASYFIAISNTAAEANVGQTPVVGTYWAAYTGPTEPDWKVDADGQATDTDRGPYYPTCVTSYFGRLVYAGSPMDPMAIWGSKIGSYGAFILGTNANSPWKHTLSADDAGRIHWLVSGVALIAGSDGGEFVLTGSELGITPTNIQVQTRTSHGSCDVQPVLMNEQAVFVQSDQQQIRGYSYLDTLGSYYASHLNAASDHILSGKAVSMALTRTPRMAVLFLDEEGKIVRMGYDRELGEISFFPWLSTDEDNGFRAIGVMPAKGRDEDLIMVLHEYYHGTFLELFHWADYMLHTDPALTTLTLPYGMYLDSAEQVTISEDDDGYYVSGLSDWDGETVDVVIDGAAHQAVTVESGVIRLNHGGDEAYIGYAFVSRAKTMNLGYPMLTKRTNQIGIRFISTVGGEVGVDEDNLETLVFREGDVYYDEANPLYSGDQIVNVVGGFSRDSHVWIKQTDPTPQTVLMLQPWIGRWE